MWKLLLFVLIGCLLSLPVSAAQITPRATFTVTLFDPDPSVDAADSNPGDGLCDVVGAPTGCSLRAAIQETNALAGADVITFAGGGMITVQTDLDFIPLNHPITVDGWTAGGAGYNGPPLVEVRNGNAAAIGFEIRSPNSLIRGLSITNFTSMGIDVANDNISISGNYVGVDLLGNPAGNNVGVQLDARGGNELYQTTIGGNLPEEGNVISANVTAGIAIRKAIADPSLVDPVWNNNFTNANRIINNFIGTNPAGDAPLGVQADGIFFGNNPKSYLIIGRPNAPNIIAGNSTDGISAPAGNYNSVSIQGNFIGTNPDGDFIGNGDDGIDISSGNLYYINENTIGDNGDNGIEISGNNDGTPDNFTAVICANYIGTDSMVRVLPNVGNGIQFDGGASQNFVGFSSTFATPSPPTCGEGNVIAFNGGTGVRLPGTTIGAERLNFIAGNSMYDNAGLGIDLGAAGMNPIDAGDLDNGANDLINAPVLTNATTGGTQLTVDVTLSHQAGLTGLANDYDVHFYANDETCPAQGEGELYLGAATLTVNPATGTVTQTVNLSLGSAVPVNFTSIIATSSGHDPLTPNTVFRNTSEFSTCAPLIVVPDLTIAKTDNPDPVIAGNALTYTLTVTNTGGDASSVTVTDTLPPGVTFVSATPPCAHAAGTVTCNLGAMGSGGTVILTIVVNAPLTAGVINNTAQVAAPGEVDTTDNSITIQTTVEAPTPTFTALPPTSTLTSFPPTFTSTSVVPTATNTLFVPTATFIVPTVTNTLFGVTATNTSVAPTNTPIVPSATLIPPTTTPIPPTATRIPPSPTPQPTNTPVPTNTPQPTLTSTLVPTNTAAPSLTASPISTQTPLPSVTMTAVQTNVIMPTLELGVTPTPGIIVDRIIAPISIGDGDDIEVNIIVNNTGAATDDLLLIQEFLASVDLVSIDDPSCIKTATSISCNLGSLGTGETTRVEFVLGSVGLNPVLSRTTVRSGTNEVVLDRPYIIKFAQPAFMTIDTEVTWTIQLLNPSSSRATGVTVTDLVPAGLEVVSVRASKGTITEDDNEVTFQLAVLNPQDAATITVVTRAREGITINPIQRNEACLRTTQHRTPYCVDTAVFRADQLPRTGESSLSWLRWTVILIPFMLWGLWKIRQQRYET